MIKAVIFDLDNTLYDYDYCHSRAMKALSQFACSKYVLNEEAFNQAFDSARKEVKVLLGDTGASHNRMLYMQLFLEKIGAEPADGALELYDVYWNSMLSDMQLFDYVAPLFDELKSKDIKICILTDLTAHIQHRKIQKLGLQNSIQILVTSEEVGAEKPSVKVFERILLKAGIQSEEALMIGDSQQKDIYGAANAGIHGILFKKENREKMCSTVMEYINEKMVQ